MKVKTGVVIGAILAAGFSMTVLGSKDAVEVCHVTGNGASFVLSVSGAALAGHLRHGDSIDLTDCGDDSGVDPR